MNSILKQINLLVNNKHMTQTDLSEKMNISRSYVAMLLSGDRVLNKELIVKFADALAVPLEQIINNQVDEDYIIRTRGEFKTRTARSKMAKIKIQMDDYIRLKGIYYNEQISSQ